METYPMLSMWWMMQNAYWILTTWTRMTVKMKRPTPTPKPKQNTHPTPTCVWVGWGLRPLIVPIGVDVFCCCCFHCSHHTLATGWVFWVCLCVLCAFFWSIGVCVECVFFLSNIVNYRKKFIFVYKLRL